MYFQHNQRQTAWWRAARAAAGLSLLLGLSSAVQAETIVYVQNNTPFAFNVAARQAGPALGGDKWRAGVTSLPPGRRDEVVRFNRDSGITSGETFFFYTSLVKDGSTLLLGQQVRGATVNSHMWQTLAGPGFENQWFDDRATHVATWNVGGMQLRVMYRAYFTGTDDNVEYILQYAYPIEARDADTLAVLVYNVYMRPTSLFKNGQSIRAHLIPPQISGYDAIVFSEAFDDDTRAELLAGLKPEYPYATSIVGSDRGVEQDGGVIIVSRWPILEQDERRYGDTCAGTDCQADKGVKYAKINRNGHIFHLFGSHTQAWPTPEGANVRAQQFRIIKSFIDSKNIPAGEPVLIGGDLNVDRLKFPNEYEQMLQILDAACPPSQGFPYTWDAVTNDLADQTGTHEYLDYVLWSRAHLIPSQSLNEPRIVRAAEEWKEYGFEKAMWDLSDHYPVYGRFNFAQPFQGRFDMTFWSKQFLYTVNQSGDLLWYSDMIGVDKNAPGESPHPDTGVKYPKTQPDEGGLGARYRVGTATSVSGVGAAKTGPRQSASAIGSVTSVSSAAIGKVTATPSPGKATVLASDPRLSAKLIDPGPHVIHQWEGPKRISTGWGAFRMILPAGASGLYGVTQDGVLKWYRHDGYADGTSKWKGPVDVNSGWNAFTRIVAAGDGVLYGIGGDGALRWYRHLDATDALPQAQAHWQGPNIVSNNWGRFVHVFSGGEGILYAVEPNGALLWFRHKGYLSGTSDWQGPATVGTGWAQFTRVFSPGDGNIYALNPDGSLWWYQHQGYQTGAATWLKPVQIASNWNAFTQVFPRMWGTRANDLH